MSHWAIKNTWHRMLVYMELQEILEDYITSKDAWNVEGDTITITELGTIHLLEKLGIIEILYARS